MAGAIRQRKQATSSGQPFAQLNFISHNMQVHAHDITQYTTGNNSFYYIDTSVLLENIPLVKYIETTSGTPSGLFSIILHVSLSMT